MTQLLNEFLSSSSAWGVLLTLAAFALGTLINRVTGKAVFNPLLLGSIFVIILLSVLNISYADYKVSAAPVSYLLLPATISLAIPLYEKWDLLKSRVPIKQYLQKFPKWGRFGVTSVTPFLLLPVHPEGCTPAHRT